MKQKKPLNQKYKGDAKKQTGENQKKENQKKQRAVKAEQTIGGLHDQPDEKQGKPLDEKALEKTPKENEPALGGEKNFQAIQQKKSSDFLQIPRYLWLLFLILGLVGGLALSTFFKQTVPPITVTPNGQNGNEPIKIGLIYSNECSFCLRHNTIFDTFKFNGIKFEVNEIEAGSTDGIQKIAAFRPGILPAAIVPADGLKAFPEIMAAMDQSFKKTGGFFVVPESNLDSSKIYPRMYIEPIDPTDCNASDPKSDVILFDDPYNEISILTQPVLNRALQEFRDYSRVRFEYIKANSSTINPDADQSLKNLTADYLVCSSIQNRFIDAYNRALSIYCSGKDLNLTQHDVLICKLNPHYGTPLSLNEIEAATIEMPGIEPKPFDECLKLAPELDKASVKRAKDYSLTRTGTAIVDCKYNVAPQAIGIAICESKPDIEPCRKNE